MSRARSIRLGAEDVPYTLVRTDRRTLGISVEPNGCVFVSAPHEASEDAIANRLMKRGPWVLKTRRDFERLRPRTPERRYVEGETHRLLGRQYRLLIEPTAARGVSLTHDHLIVGGLQPREIDQIKKNLALWYEHKARRVFSERLNTCLVHAASAGPPPRLVVRPMEKRWGSLSSTGRSLILNRRLVEADVACIDFVIVHELCHLSHRDHGPEFLALLSARMPDWRNRKQVLERWML